MSLNKKKSVVVARDMAARLRLRLPSSWSVVESVDASSNPVITASADSTPAATEQVAVIRVKEMDSLGQDSLGLAQQSYGPHVVQIVLEEPPATWETATQDNVILEATSFMVVLGEALHTGARVELYTCNTNNLPAVSFIDATNLKKVFEDLQFPPMLGV